MNRTVYHYMEKTHMIKEQDYVIAGVSGGADSVCLLLLLADYRRQVSFDLEVVHVEHGIRGQESRQDAEFVADLCRHLQIRCTICPVNVPDFAGKHHLGIEESARILRFREFEAAICRKMDDGIPPNHIKVALAHHREDNAETVLFQMVRGSGLTGLCGMRPVRREEEGYCYIRPLLSISRKDIECFLKERGQKYCEDSTNCDVTYARNNLRHQVFPLLEQVNRQAVAHIGQTAAQLSLIQDYMEQQAEQAMEQVVTETGQQLRIQIGGLLRFHPALQEAILRRALFQKAGHQKDITSAHIASMQELMERQSGRRADLPYQVTVRREYDELVLSNSIYEDKHQCNKKEMHEITETDLQQMKQDGKEYEIILSETERVWMRVFSYDGDLSKIIKKTYTKWFDYDMIEKGVQIRHRIPKDRLCVDAQGHHKKLKQYLTDQKIPSVSRDGLWLMADGNEVIWLLGERMSEAYKVSKDTSYILEVRYER